MQRAIGAVCLKTQPLITDDDTNIDNQRFADKLKTPLGKKLPDPSIVTEWDKDVSHIPPVSDSTLYNFLVLNCNRTRDAKQTNAKRQLKAKVFYKDRHVHSVMYSYISDDCSN